jgi:amino acid transporter
VVFFSYIGFAAIADAGGEVRNPRRNLPLGMLVSVVLVTVIYLAVVVVTYGSLPVDSITAAGNVPAAAALFLGSGVALFISFIAFTALISDISPSILATSRLSMAWAQDAVVPRRLATLSRFHTPRWTLILIAVIAIGVVVLFESFIEAINVTTIAILLTYSMVCVAALVMPYKRPDLWQAATMKIPGMWLVSILGLVTSLVLLGYLIQESTAQFGAVVVWVGVGATLYHFTRNNHQLEYKLIREAESGIRAVVDGEARRAR